jgi:LETM1 and EF-hand domain-containing protein 1
VSPTSSPEDAVQATLSSLPDELVDELGMTELGDEDTLAQRTRKLQYLRRQEELIKAEEARAAKVGFGGLGFRF